MKTFSPAILLALLLCLSHKPGLSYFQKKKKHTPALFFIFILLFSGFNNSAVAQFSVGPHFSTFNLPAVPFKTNGAGITGEFDGRFTFSLDYFSNKQPADSIGYIPDGSINTVYTQYQIQDKFIHLSASFLAPIVGGRSSEKKFSLYLGAGLAGVYRMRKINYLNTAPPQTEKENKIVPGFEFLAGMDYNLGFAKLFLRGKESILLSHVIPADDDTALPLLSNTQIGILIPFHSN